MLFKLPPHFELLNIQCGKHFSWLRHIYVHSAFVMINIKKADAFVNYTKSLVL